MGNIGTSEKPRRDPSCPVANLDNDWDEACPCRAAEAGMVRGETGSVAVLDIDAMDPKLPLASRESTRGPAPPPPSPLYDGKRTRPFKPDPPPRSARKAAASFESRSRLVVGRAGDGEVAIRSSMSAASVSSAVPTRSRGVIFGVPAPSGRRLLPCDTLGRRAFACDSAGEAWDMAGECGGVAVG